jgi:ferredoxin
VKKIPVLDPGECVDCEACLALCPAVFKRNEAGYIEVADLKEYPENEVQEAISTCPRECIAWAEAQRTMRF